MRKRLLNLRVPSEGASGDEPDTMGRDIVIIDGRIAAIEPPSARPAEADEERIDLETAIAAFTINAAYLNKHEDRTSSIEVGKLADLAVLDRDYFSIPDEEIKDIQAEMTMVGGDIVWERA